jgi:hypothetical protein
VACGRQPMAAVSPGSTRTAHRRGGGELVAL